MEQDRFEHPIRDDFETDAFVVRPLREAHASLDYAAVMESRDDLRRSSLGTWPRDGFTLEENRRDLARHEREHNDGSSFTYTVIGPDGSECLGCVYVTPLPTHLVRVGAPRELVNTATWSQAAVFFWVRSQRIRGGLEPQLLSALRSWFRLDWRASTCSSPRTRRIHDR